MRFIAVGIILLGLVSSTLAGVFGKVESIGFGSYIRPDCTIPLVVTITSDANGPQDYQLQVVQLDRDGDEVCYSRPIVVNPGQQRFWTYFKPETINGGLPNQKAGTPTDLAKRLRLFLTNPDGSKRLVQISSKEKMPQTLDGYEGPGSKLILVVGRVPNVNEFDPSAERLFGLPEDVQFVNLSLDHLPDNEMGYEAVDAIVWTTEESEKLSAQQFRAIRQYVRNGGKLVIVQSPGLASSARFADLLPVQVQRTDDYDSLDPLKSLLILPSDKPKNARTGIAFDPFADVNPPYRMTRATPLADAFVDTEVKWADKTTSPYIARHLFGQGMVAWVAQDISDPTYRAISSGWPRFWDHVFDWHLSKSIQLPSITNKEYKDIKSNWRAAGERDIGASFVDQLDLNSKTLALMSLAFVFFIGYWFIAGPGLQLVLAMKKKTQWSWFIFGAIAVLATILTAGVAEIVLRGAPQIRHVSMVRFPLSASDPAHIQSRFGVYVPRDEPNLAITLTEHDPDTAGLIWPLTSWRPGTEQAVSPRDSRYVVPITNEDVAEQTSVGVPFRSTLKQLQSDWTGNLEGRITGTARLLNENNKAIGGNLSNNSGRDLSHVLIVFPYPGVREWQDRVLYIRLWPKGQTIDLGDLYEKAKNDSGTVSSSDSKPMLPLDKSVVRGLLENVGTWLLDDLRSGNIVGPGNSAYSDSKSDYRRSFPIVSLYDRLSPMENKQNSNNRVDLLRRGMRRWDCSGALASGAMVILAQSSGEPMPAPLEVGGEKPEGVGTNFWQFVLPLDRSAVKLVSETASKE